MLLKTIWLGNSRTGIQSSGSWVWCQDLHHSSPLPSSQALPDISFNLHSNPRGGYYCCLLFTDEETEARRGTPIIQGEQQSSTLTASLSPKSMLLSILQFLSISCFKDLFQKEEVSAGLAELKWMGEDAVGNCRSHMLCVQAS